MNTIGPDFSEGTAALFTWIADKVWGGAKSAVNWGMDQAKWNLAQDVYDREIIRQYGQIRIFGQTTPKSLRDIFTDVYVLDKPTAARRYSADKLADHLWNEDRGLSFRQDEAQPGEQALERGTKFFILGKPGAGKTTFLKRLAVREAQRGKWGRCVGKVPIFVSLKQLAESGKPMLDFIVDQFAVCHFPEAEPFIRGLLESGQALVLFDGLDEVTTAEDFQSNRRGQVAEALERFAWQFRDCHIIVTCRIAATDFTFGAGFTYLEMSDFSPEQVASFVRNWYRSEDEAQEASAIAEQMLDELIMPEHSGIRDLTRNPLLLTLLCLNYDETRSFPARRVEIYEEALDALLKKWDSSRNVQRGGLYRSLSLGRKRQMFAQVAFDAFARGEILFPQKSLEEGIKAYLRYVPEIPESIDIEAEVVIKEIVAQHGIFTEQARGLFSFAHLTFQEYYAAQYVSDAASPNAMKILLSHINDSRWREVFLLASSMLRDATAFLNEFESALRQLVARRPQLLSWMQYGVQQAETSQSGYRRSAIRGWLVGKPVLDLVSATELVTPHARLPDLARALVLSRAVDFDHTRILDRSRQFDRARALVSDSDFDRARSLTRSLSHTVELALALDPTLDLDLASAASRSLDGTFEHDFPHLAQLVAESAAYEKSIEEIGRVESEDFEVLRDYAQGISLFYECLQLAYVPDKRGFEDRMFLPSETAEAGQKD